MLDRVKKTDFLFGLMGALAVFLAAAEGFRETPPAPLSSSPWVAAAVVMGVIALISAFVIRVARLDKYNSDEFVFAIVTKSAVIGLMTALVGIQVLDLRFLFGSVVPQVTADHMVALAIGGWSVGYFFYRIRGTTA